VNAPQAVASFERKQKLKQKQKRKNDDEIVTVAKKVRHFG